MQSRLGIDLGSVTAKLVLIGEDGEILFSDYRPHQGRPLAALAEALKVLAREAPPPGPLPAAVTGSGREAASRLLGLPAVNEIVAQAVAASCGRERARTVVEIGGQDSKCIRLGPARAPGTPVILDQRMNDICAAGTGAFIEQQAERLCIPIDAFGAQALASRTPALVAGRCAVFSKTDVTHLLQEGKETRDIAAGICEAVVRNYLAQFSSGRRFEAPVVFHGGVAANQGVVRAFREALTLGEEAFLVPPHFEVMGALGAAVLAATEKDARAVRIDDLIERLTARARRGRPGAGAGGGRVLSPASEMTASASRVVSAQPDYPVTPCNSRPLPRPPGRLPRLAPGTKRLATFPAAPPGAPGGAFVGVDVGSTSTCIAILDLKARLVAESYTLNRGDVIASVDRALEDIRAALGARVQNLHVRGAGVTGSGRRLVSRYLGADLVRDEISAQARAAVHMCPDADTVFEIGGQDSKYIRLAGGRVADFEMNRVCSAGTGAFLHELASRLGEDVHALGPKAFESGEPADLGSRCTVFMESDLIHHQQTGRPRPDLIAGLSYSVARNYIEKVVGGRPVGRCVLLLGGVAYNESVVAALQGLLGQEVLVPEPHATSAALGMALLAREESAGRAEGSRFRGFAPRAGAYEIRTFQCTECPNACRVSRVEADGEVHCYGGACGRHEAGRRRQPSRDLFREREALLLQCLDRERGAGRERMGVPRVLLFHEHFPLWCTFLQELGFEVVLSEATHRGIIRKGLERTPIENCLASKIVPGHLQDLVEKGVERIFLPSVVEFERRVPDLERNYACPQVQALPALVRGSVPVEIVSPVFVRDRSDDDWRKELAALGRRLGRPARRVWRAIERAAQAQAGFRAGCERLGRALLEGEAPEEPVLVVLGKTYNVCDPALNLNVPAKLAAAGALPVPFDCLPLSQERLGGEYRDLVWAGGQDLARAALLVARCSRLHAGLVTSFGCGPDSFAVKYLAEILRGEPFLTLEVDEHTSEVGLVTRIEAFLANLRPRPAAKAARSAPAFRPFVPSRRLRRYGGTVYVPQPFADFRVLAAGLESAGVRTRLLPPHDGETERLGRRYSSGRECLPYIMYLGDAVRMTREPGFDPGRAAFCIPGSDLACRVSAYPTAIRLVLAELGFPQVPVLAPRVSMDRDEFLEVFGVRFARGLFRGILAVEALGKRLTETRPYEREPGASDRAHEEGVRAVCGALVRGGFRAALRGALARFDAIALEHAGSRPVVGLIGDEYTRSTAFANRDVVRQIESLGGEVWNAPVWGNYLEFQRVAKPGRMLRRGRWGELLLDLAKSALERFERRRLARLLDGRVRYPDPDYAEMVACAAEHLDARSEPLAIIGLAHAVHLVRHGVDGIVNLGAFQCMINSVVSARLRSLAERLGVPLLTLAFDFQERVHLRNRLEAFMHQVREFRRSRPARAAGAVRRRR